MIRTALLSTPILFAAAAAAVQPSAQPQLVPAIAPLDPAAPARLGESHIDVVFVLDTTGSMGGLIDGAKQKIWSIANTIATAKPRPEIRMGLVAYRDRGESYITKLTPLTDDLDAVYAELMALTAEGGGDTPESVNEGLHDAVTSFDWSAQPSALRLIYLVGDSPPHMDYEGDVKYEASCEMAAKRGIIVNTIQCGSYVRTTPIWQEIARSSEGDFFQIEQSGGVVAVATPFDTDLAKLTIDLEATVIPYGDTAAVAEQAARHERAQDLAEAAPTEALAARAMYKASDAGIASLCGRQELIQDCLDKKVDLAKLPAEQLPEAMRSMTPAERQAYVHTKASERDGLRKQIQALNIKRQEHITNVVAAEGTPQDSFDAAVIRTLQRQAARCNIAFDADSK
jgi:Mg-chelatase subunit ChlD